MTINTNSDMRFMSNNYLNTGYNTFETTPIADNFLKTNMIDDQRSKVTRFSGRFLIDSTNNKIYIGGVTYTVTSADYATPTLLAAAMTTALSAISVTVTYSTTTRIFTFSRAIAFTANYSTLTNAIWETIGIYSVIDTAAVFSGSFKLFSEVQRIHWPYERITIDFGYQADLGFVGIIGDLSNEIAIPESAIVTFKANTINSFASPNISQVLAWREKGIFHFFDDIADTANRYVEITIEAPEGPGPIEIGHLYVGDSTQFSNRNISNGIEIELADNSILTSAENGQVYANRKVPVRIFSNLKVGLVSPANVTFLKNLFYLKQLSAPFFVCLDPQEVISSDDEMLMFCRFNDEPRIKHIINSIYEIDFSLREAM